MLYVKVGLSLSDVALEGNLDLDLADSSRPRKRSWGIVFVEL